MDGPCLPNQDSDGRVTAPAPARLLLVACSVGGAALFAVAAWRMALQQNEMGFVLSGVLALLFAILSGYFLLAPYQVILDETGISAGLAGMAPRMRWDRIETITLLGNPAKQVVLGGRLTDKPAAQHTRLTLRSLTPLSPQGTASYLLQQAKKRGEPVSGISTASRQTGLSPLALLLILALAAAKIGLMVLRVHNSAGQH